MNHPVVRPAAISVGVGLLVIAAALLAALPGVALAQHWSLAWAGLDLATATCALLTAALVRTGDPRAALPAAAGAALLAVDAWFDVCTAAPGQDLAIAVVEAALVELPLAALALRFALEVLTTATRLTGHDAARECGDPERSGQRCVIADLTPVAVRRSARRA